MPVLGLSRGLPFYQMYPKGLSFSSLLFNCGGLVGDYGQEGRPIKDMQAVSFNGVDQYGLIEDMPDTLPITFEAVIKPKLAGLAFIYTLTNPQDSDGKYRGIDIAVTPTNNVAVRFGDGGGLASQNRRSYVTDGALNVNQWHKIKCVINSFDDVSISIDDFDQQLTISGNASTFTNLSTTHGICTSSQNITGELDVAHLSINGTIYSFQETSGSTVFDRSGGGNHATLINNPTRVIDNSAELADYDVVNTIGYSKAVQGDGATGHITLDETSLQITSLRVRFIVPANPTLSPYIAGWRSSVDNIRFHITQNPDGDVSAFIGAESFIFADVSVGDKLDVEINVDGSVFLGGSLVASLSPITPISEVSSYLLTQSNNGLASAAKSDAILLQAWVNGEEVDIFDTSKHVGTVNDLVIPPSSNNDGLDALGNPLDVKGSAYPALPVPVNSKGLGFNGVDQYAVADGLSTADLTDVTISATLYVSSATSATRGVWSRGSSSYRVFLNTSTTVTIVSTNTGVDIPKDVWFKLEIDYVGSNAVRLRIDGVELWTGSVSNSTGIGQDFTIGAYGGGSPAGFFSGSIAHFQITGDTNLSIPFNNNSPYDLASDGSVVNFINNPTQVDQDVYHAELEDGFYKAVRGDGTYNSRISSLVPINQVTSVRGRFLITVLNNPLMGNFDVNDSRGHLYTNFINKTTDSAEIGFFIGEGDFLRSPQRVYLGDTVDLEMHSNGDAYFNGVLVGNNNNEYLQSSTTLMPFLSYGSPTGFWGLNENILLQAWVNGQEIDIHDPAHHVGTIETHRLVGYSDLTNPAIPKGHNDANTGFNLTHLTEGGNTPPAITATGQDVQNYRFGDSLTNPSFKRVLSPVGEDRHSLFKEPLTGACLGKAQGFFSIGFPYSFPIQLS